MKTQSQAVQKYFMGIKNLIWVTRDGTTPISGTVCRLLGNVTFR